MQIHEHFSLKNYNSFGIDTFAKQFIAVQTVDELCTVLAEFKTLKKFILGGGSNMLLTQNIDALVIHIDIKGKIIDQQNDDYVWIKCNAGENWHEFVIWTINQNYGGLENLSLIPGNVGAAPVQNIGAYGTEIKDTLTSCEAINIENQEFKSFSNTDCKFGYRESIFKNEEKNKYIITSVTFKLTKKNHNITTSYGDILSELPVNNTPSTLIDISNAVIAIRKSKLPDPKELGNSGSFFKNPIVSKTAFEPILKKFPEMRFFTISDTEVKIPAGWLIEHAGLKGKRFGNAGIHERQALVLVNYGGATGQEILEVSKVVQETVFKKFGIAIETEVNII